MAEENTEEIKCPYCGYEFSDSWEYNGNHDGDDYDIECRSCNREFSMIFHLTVSYTTRRKECVEGKHEWKEPNPWEIDEEFIKRNKHKETKPYMFWTRKCENCEETQYSPYMDIGSLCPDPFVDAHAEKPAETSPPKESVQSPS